MLCAVDITCWRSCYDFLINSLFSVGSSDGHNGGSHRCYLKYRPSGCSIMIDQKSKLHTWTKIQHRSWERCIFLIMFGYLKILSLKVLMSFMYSSNFGGTLILKFWKYAIYIENQGVNKRQYCCANISATKALIFTNFYVVVKYYLQGTHQETHLYSHQAPHPLQADELGGPISHCVLSLGK